MKEVKVIVQNGRLYFTVGDVLVGEQSGFKTHDEGEATIRRLYASRASVGSATFAERERNDAYKALDKHFAKATEPKFPLPPSKKSKNRRVSGEATRELA
jgi:hypothetical protein